MQKQTLALLAGAMIVVFGSAFALPALLGTDDTPIVRWDAKDEQDVPDTTEPEAGSVPADAAVERTSVELAAAGAVDDARVDVTLRGRVVDKFQGPVANATVWLDFARGGQRGGGPASRQRRVPDPVQTDREGRFAFQGQTFRNLRVSLQVASKQHAPGLFDKDLGEVAAEMDLGDLVLTNGGEVLGRVTDLEGNGIAAASIDLGPENGNRMRMVRDRSNLIGKVATDQNGYFRALHVAAGDWSANATAKKHTEARSATFAVEEDQATEIEDIRLGPGFEVTGYVRTTQGQPIAKAEVSLQGQGPRGRNPGGQGGPGGGFDWRQGGRDHSTTTDEQGRFFLEHLPGVPMRVETRADGYLDYGQDGVDITLGQPLQITLQDGLRIAGVVTDAVDAQLVTSFAVRAVRVRGLPVPGAANVDFGALMTQMRDPNLDEATRQQLRQQIEAARASAGEARRGGPGGGPGQGRGGDRGEEPRPGGLRDLGKPESHPDGAFVVTGLQEGVYEVHVQSPDHARFRSQEVEVRLGVAAPTVAAKLDRGVYVAGIVRNDKGQPVQGARVELRTASATDGGNGPGRRGRGGQAANPANGGSGNQGGDFAAMGREMMRQAAGVQLNLEATTDAEGEFIVKHAPRGSYRAQAEAKGFAAATSPVFDLQADKSGLELEVGSLGALAGHVRGLSSKEYPEARVGAVPVGGQGGGFGGMRGGRGGGPGQGPFNSVPVQADGSYRIADLAPGDYVVRSWIGSPQELMRELGPQFFSGTLAPDAKVRGGDTTQLDVAVVRPAVGEVAGTVLHNGSPAAGFQVELSRLDDNGAAADPRNGRGPGGGMGGRGGMFGGGRTFQTTVTNSGRFSIKDVPAGNYRLRVNAARRGGTLHEETLAVAADAIAERNVAVTTASLAGIVTGDDANKAAWNGSISLLPGLTELPENWNQWRRDPGNTTFDARVQNGAFQFDSLKPGNYLAVLSIRGRERSTLPIVVSPGAGQQIAIAAGKVQEAPTPGANGPGRPNAPAAGRPR